MTENAQPISCVLSYLTGTVPPGSAVLGKQGIVFTAPEWIPENCIQCSLCSLVCPHAAIHSVILKENEKQEPCACHPTIEMKGMDGYRFAVMVSLSDCAGCGLCVSACPGKGEKKALHLEKNSVCVDRKNQK